MLSGWWLGLALALAREGQSDLLTIERWWPSRLVATAAENRLTFRRNAHSGLRQATDCRTIAFDSLTRRSQWAFTRPA